MKINKKDKIRNAKAFARLHKISILPVGANEENATDGDWIRIFNYIWDSLRSENGEPPYIEIRSHETKSGHIEIFQMDSSKMDDEWFNEDE